MQIDHPAHRFLIIPRAENVLRRPLTDLLQSALFLLNLHLDLINHVVAPLVLQLQYRGILLPDAFAEFILLLSALPVVVIVLLVKTTLHFHKAFDKCTCPELIVLAPLATDYARFYVTLGGLVENFVQRVVVLVAEHGERHLEDLFDHVHVAENVVQILQHRV